jgi:hypothetical protein
MQKWNIFNNSYRHPIYNFLKKIQQVAQLIFFAHHFKLNGSDIPWMIGVTHMKVFIDNENG